MSAIGPKQTLARAVAGFEHFKTLSSCNLVIWRLASRCVCLPKALGVAVNQPRLSAIGFSDQGHLARHFRGLLGTTPREFRRSQR